MMAKPSLICVLFFMNLTLARKLPPHYLTVNEHNEIILFSGMQSTFSVLSSYKESPQTQSYLTVQCRDPDQLWVMNITRMSSAVPGFTVRVKAREEGETTLKVQLWDLQGGLRSLIEESKETKVKVVTKTAPRHVSESKEKFATNLLLFLLPLILLNKCAFGCKIEMETLQNLWKEPSPVVLGAAVQFLLMPLFGFLVTRIMSFSPLLSYGFIMACTCPGGGGGYLYALLLEGDITLAISMACTSTFLALFMMPINSSLYSRILGLSSSLHIPFLKIMLTLLSIAIPISGGIIVKQRLPNGAKYLERVIRPFSLVIVFVGIYLSCQMGSVFLKAVNMKLLLMGTLVPAFGLSFGYFFSARLFKLPVPACKTVAIECGVQNCFLALVIIQFSFPQPEADLTSVAPFLVAMCCACEMILVLFFYSTRKKKM
ncbi:sodium/bile acid cotransporter 5 [Microcaecilia unicolor]|uniref:Sodium/bile acid cotransporter 5 n=1 Tax=Microcaecilia unicolor TaxID=1415580 RepID=A0A6P7WS81_9AMPH|nr:sodium/bile acid cotransporter 5 [Microcaecilia unicolor]